MNRRTWRLLAVTTALTAAGGIGACSDRGSTEPKFERPTGTIIGLDESKRVVGPELGGNQAMLEIANHVSSVPLDARDPLVEAVAEWRTRRAAVSNESAIAMFGGVEEYDGDYYVWSEGESYAPAHKQAKIYNLVGRPSRIGGDGPVDIIVTFSFDGHEASNDAHWTLARSNGEVIRSRPLGPFGSQTDPFLNMTSFGARGWAASSSEQDVGCDIKVSGSTRPKAWYVGTWTVGGVSIGVTPTGPNGGVDLAKGGRRGEVEASTGLNTQFTCPPDDGYGGGDLDCLVCQQWFFRVSLDEYLEWWECDLTDPQECENGDAT